MRELGYENKSETKAIFAPPPSIIMSSNIDIKGFSKEALENKVIVLEKQLLEAQIKAEGYLLMIDVAEEEFKIPIQKKSDSK